MDDERIVISSSAAISPEAVAGKGFTTGMRGYQPAEVRQFLGRVADELAAAVAREAELRRAVHEAEARAAHPDLDESVLTSSLGEHAGRLIASARETAAAITAEAERTAAATLRDAEYRIARIRSEADTLMARRVDEADGVSASLRQSAEADARAIHDQAQAEAEAAIQAARSHGKEMVAEARAVRERMLGDLARRRRVAEVQLEQLRVARGRLVEAYEVVRRTLEEVTAELAAAEPEARLAAEAVGRRMHEAEPPPPLRLADPPLRMGMGPTGVPPIPPVPTSRFDAPNRAGDRFGDAGARPVPSVSQGPSPSQPTHPAPPSMPASVAPAAPLPPPPAEPGGPASVPSGWIERAGGTGGPASGRSSMPPSIAGPVLVPAAGVGGGHAPAAVPVDEPRPRGSGSWAGAGFGPPRDPGSPSRPVDPGPSPAAEGTAGASGPAATSWSTPGSPSSSSVGASASREPSSTVGLAPPPQPSRPPLRPQTVAESLPSRSRDGTVAPGPGSSGSAPSALAPTSSAPTTGSLSALAPTDPTTGPGAPSPVPTDSATANPAGPAPSTTMSLSTGLRPVPPDLPLEVPPAEPEQAPELATAEVPSVADRAEGPAPVEELFARLRHQVPPDETPAPPAPAPASPPEGVIDEDALARRDQHLDPLDADLTRSLKRILQDEQNDVLERLREGGPAASSSVLDALEHQTSSFTSAAAPVLAAAFRAGGGEGDDTTGFALGGKLANDLAAPLRERLERVVTGAGDDLEELAEAVRAAYRHAKLQEIEQLVRHHTAAAHALGAFAATPGDTKLRWVVDDEGPCPDCHDNTLAGPTPKGEPYPTGQDHPPAHLGCRCLLVPVAT